MKRYKITGLLLIGILSSFIGCSSKVSKDDSLRNVAQELSANNSWSSFNSNLPRCPLMGGRPPEDMPIAGLVIPGVGSYFSDEDITSVAVEAITSAPDSPSRVFIVQSEYQKDLKDKIIQNLDSKSLSYFQKLAARNRISTVLTEGSPIAWNQDYIHSTVGPGDTRARIYYLKNYDSSKTKDSGQTRDSIRQILKKASESNSIGTTVFQEMPAISSSPIHAGYYGGNILSLPNGNCLVGRSRFESDKAAQSFARTVGCENEVLVVDTSWLSVSHIDEVVSYLSSDGDICNTNFRIPSPSLAKQLMQKNPHEIFLPMEKLDPTAKVNIETRMSALPDLEKVCLAKYMSIGPWCLNMTNEEILKYASSEFWEINESIQVKLTQMKRDIQAFVKKSNKCVPHFAESPLLFSASIYEGEIIQGRTVHANSVNSVLLSKSLLLPMTGNRIFDDWNKEIIEKQNHKAIFLNTFRANLAGGNVHCLIKAIRTCNPQR